MEKYLRSNYQIYLIIVTNRFRCVRSYNILHLQNNVCICVWMSLHCKHNEWMTSDSKSDSLFKRLNLLELKGIFKLIVIKLDCKFNHNLLPGYTLNMFKESIRNPYCNLRARGPLELVNPSTTFGENCIRCYLINNSRSEVPDKVNTHLYEGFSFFIRKTH